jgi:hypothetical protein
MPNEETAHKLSAKEQLDLCALIAIGYNAQRCADIFEEEQGIILSNDNIYQNYIRNPKWQKIIKRMRREAERKVLSHPLAKKINRLKLLQDAINEAFTWRLDKINYDKEGNELSRVEKRNIGMIAALIREARTEIEGEKGTEIKVGIGVNVNGNSNGAIDKDLQHRLREHFGIPRAGIQEEQPK